MEPEVALAVITRLDVGKCKLITSTKHFHSLIETPLTPGGKLGDKFILGIDYLQAFEVLGSCSDCSGLQALCGTSNSLYC